MPRSRTEPQTGYELTLVPAYGRDYKTAEEMLKAWQGGKDFMIQCIMSPWDGKYTSIADLASFPGKHVRIRYNRRTRIALIDIKTGAVQSDDKEPK